MPKLSLDDIISGVNEIPALPHVVVTVMQMTEDPNSTVQDINNALNKDQAMTARVLRLANSAFYGFARRIGSVTEAVVFLGFKTIRGIVLAAAVSDIMNRKLDGYALEKGELWKHSQACAIAARTIARRAKYSNIDLAFTVGLLHDIGKLILNQTLKEAYIEVVEKVENEDKTFLQAEDEVLGFNHAIVGGKIVEKWKLPNQLVEAILYHHEPDLAPNDKALVAIVHIADVLCVSLGIGIGIDGMLYQLHSDCLSILGLNEEDFDEIASELTDLYADL